MPDLAAIQQAIAELSERERTVLLGWLKKLNAAERRSNRRNARMNPSLLRAVLWSVAGLVCFFALDAALFHTGLYNKYVEPESSAGELEYRLLWLRRAQPKEIAVVGDSRIAEGLSVRDAGAATGGRLKFFNFGMPGSTPRVWYYALRDADPKRDRFGAIVFALGQYSDQDLAEDERERAGDLNYLVGRLRYSDCVEFARSYGSSEGRRRALTGCLFRGIALRPDLQSLLESPIDRVRRARDARDHGRDYIDGYGGKPETMTGLSADFEKRTLHLPSPLKPIVIASIKATVLPLLVPQTGAETEYRKRWLGAILDIYRDSPTPIVFTELPRAPLPIPEPKTPARFLDSAVKRPHVSVLPAATFRDLERPDLFADGLHLNHVGRPLYSRRMGERIAALVK